MQQTLLNCSIRKLKSVNRNLCFQNNYSKLSVNSKIGRFVKLILFSELVLPSWLRHILYNGFDSSSPVIEVMIFIPTWPTIRWRMFNIPKRILVSTYMLIASAWKLIVFEYENNESRESNNHTKRLNWYIIKIFRGGRGGGWGGGAAVKGAWSGVVGGGGH